MTYLARHDLENRYLHYFTSSFAKMIKTFIVGEDHMHAIELRDVDARGEGPNEISYRVLGEEPVVPYASEDVLENTIPIDNNGDGSMQNHQQFGFVGGQNEMPWHGGDVPSLLDDSSRNTILMEMARATLSMPRW